MNPLAPSPTAFDLHWRLCGIGFRVQPMFWIINLVFGYMYLQNLSGWDGRQFAYLGIWLGCAFVSILAHELGHVIAGRIFGQSSNIILHGMGGVAIGSFERLKPWQRIILYAAGPAVGLTLFAFVEWGLPALLHAVEPNWLISRWYTVTANPSRIFEQGTFGSRGLPGVLILMNLFWTVFNLLPIIPLDGGMIMRELVCLVFPRLGTRLAYGFSFLFAGGIALYSVMAMWRPLPFPPLLDKLFTALMFGWVALNSFQGLQALAPPAKRWQQYEERDW